MNRLFLTLILLLTFTLVPMNKADASGSTTVFMPVRLSEYKVINAMQDSAFTSSFLFNYFESADQNSMWVSRVSPNIYRTTYYYTYYGYDVDLAFDAFETVTFKYYPSIRAIVGITQKDELVLLLPQFPEPPKLGSGFFTP